MVCSCVWALFIGKGVKLTFLITHSVRERVSRARTAGRAKA
jgi:hypothetical protein